jgi:hypothetical protein
VASAGKASFKPGTKGNEVRFGAGPSFGVHDSWHAGRHWHGGNVQGKFALEALFHFKGNPEGPALGPYVHFRTSGRHNFGGAIGPMFAWDIRVPPRKQVAFYISPHAGLGWGWNHHLDHHHGNSDHHGYTIHYFNMQVGVTGRLIINNVFEIWFRPLNTDIYIGADSDRVFLEVLAGIGFNF